jgi:hypothetical protein
MAICGTKWIIAEVGVGNRVGRLILIVIKSNGKDWVMMMAKQKTATETKNSDSDNDDEPSSPFRPLQNPLPFQPLSPNPINLSPSYI